MLADKENINIKDFGTEFRKRFSSFAEKAPVIISYRCTDINCTVSAVINEDDYEMKTFEFDFTVDVKSNIKEIKDWLVENVYPVIICEKINYSNYTTEEIKELVDSEQYPLQEALALKKEEKIIARWRIEKIIIKRDEFFLRDLDSDKMFRYQLNMPTPIFLRKLRNKSYTPEQLGELFFDKAKILNEIYKDFEKMPNKNY